MNSNGTRIAAAVVAIALVVVLFFVFRGGEDGDDATTATTAATTTTATDTTDKETKPEKPKPPSMPTITIKNGEPVGGVADLSFDKGDEVRFAVESDVADEIHVHGYDIEEEVPAGGRAKFDFPADIDGVFEVELHGSGTQIAELTVNP